jgi:hypothetical protein
MHLFLPVCTVFTETLAAEWASKGGGGASSTVVAIGVIVIVVLILAGAYFSGVFNSAATKTRDL